MSATPEFGLIADIGGTNARFALVGGDGRPFEERVLRVGEFASLEDAVRAYLALVGGGVAPRRAAVGIASAIRGDRVRMTNLSWDFSIEETRRHLGLDRLRMLNDLAAMALAIPHLDAAHTRRMGAGEAAPGAPIAIVAPGTGLGVGALVTVGGEAAPVASEGGHVSFAADDDAEAAIVARIRARFGHVSAERLLAGPGLVNLYVAICELAGATPDPGIDPATVSARGSDGSCPFCVQTLRNYSAMLGGFAGNAALNFVATGGVYLAGGVPARLGAAFDEAAFRARFEAKGRFRDYLSAIPTIRITHDTLAFLGLSHAL